MNLDRAVDIIARAIVAELARDEAGDKWEDHPLIGEFDFGEVEARVEEMVSEISPTSAEYDAAYEWFADRAEDDA